MCADCKELIQANQTAIRELAKQIRIIRYELDCLVPYERRGSKHEWQY